MKQGRINFEIIRQQYKKRGTDSVRLTESTLILIQDINPTKTVYNFDVLEPQGGTNNSIKPEEIRLNMNDEFIATSAGVYLFGNLHEDAPNPKIKMPIYLTYAPVETGSDFIKSAGLYDGTVRYGVNNIVYIEKWDTRKCKFIPRTQFDTYDGAVTQSATLPSLDFSENGIIPLDPMITISGAKKNEITLSLANAIDVSTGSWTTKDIPLILDITGIALVMRGLNAQNAAKFQ